MFGRLVTRSPAACFRFSNSTSLSLLRASPRCFVPISGYQQRFYSEENKEKQQNQANQENPKAETEDNENKENTKEDDKATQKEDVFEEEEFGAEEEVEEEDTTKEQVHPYAIQSNSVFYEGPFANSVKVLKRLSISGCALTTLLSPLITVFGDDSIPLIARCFYSTVVFSLGLTSTGIVHIFVTPYVTNMKLVKSEKAKTEADIPVKQKKTKETASESTEEVNNEEGVENDANNENDAWSDEEVVEDEEESEDEEPEVYDLNGCSVEYTTLSILGYNQTSVTELDGIRPGTNAIGTTNYITKEGTNLFIHEDFLANEGHEWFLRHVNRRRENPIAENETKPSSEEPSTKE